MESKNSYNYQKKKKKQSVSQTCVCHTKILKRVIKTLHFFYIEHQTSYKLYKQHKKSFCTNKEKKNTNYNNSKNV